MPLKRASGSRSPISSRRRLLLVGDPRSARTLKHRVARLSDYESLLMIKPLPAPAPRVHKFEPTP